MLQLNEVVQTNAASAEELASTAVSLKGQSQTLQDILTAGYKEEQETVVNDKIGSIGQETDSL